MGFPLFVYGSGCGRRAASPAWLYRRVSSSAIADNSAVPRIDEAELRLQPVDVLFLTLENVLEELPAHVVLYRFAIADRLGIADVAAASVAEWEDTSRGPSVTVTRRATFLGLPLH